MSSENLFHGLSHQEVGAVVKSVHHQVRNFSKGEVVVHEGDTCDNLIFLLSGVVRTEFMSSEGQVFVVEQLEAPATLFPASLFSSERIIPVSVHADTDCRALYLPRESIREVLSKTPVVMTNFLRVLSNRLQFLTTKMKMFQFLTLRGKFIRHILELHHVQQSDELILQHSQQELAEIFGVARPSLARVIRELHNEELLYAKGKKIKIIDKQKLQQQMK
ncbi:MAG: Crp/Fnr family transcriptional regulator [Bacteroidales bacterium]|nr:Crp/Fnr family transcriptional regulator [Bacteroidales bacterium]